MRNLILVTLLCGVAASGCIWKKKASQPAAAAAPQPTFAPVPAQPSTSAQKLIVTPETGLAGKVVTVNASGHFVVLGFPVGHLPAMEQHLMLYRHGLKTGEVKITGPQMEDNVVADIVAGDAEAGDEARDR
jgi:hypothetical protein